MSHRSEHEKVFKELIKQGWRIEHNRHVKCIPPDKSKPIVTCGFSPSDRRAVDNFKSQCRKSGADILTIGLAG